MENLPIQMFRLPDRGCLCGDMYVPDLHGLPVHADCSDWIHTWVPLGAAEGPIQLAGGGPEGRVHRGHWLHRDWGELLGFSAFPLVWDRSGSICLSVPQWFLVKQQAYKVSLAGSLFFAGLLVGNIVFGPLSDKIGRRPVYLSGKRSGQVNVLRSRELYRML